MKPYLITLLLSLSITFSFSQETTNKINSLETQFDDIYRTSTSYQVYKVISKERYQKLKLNVLDSLNSSKKIISEKEILLKKEENNIEETKNLLAKTKLELDTAKKKENSISLLGIELSKTTYNLLLWSVIVLLLLGLSYFVFKFFRSNVLTKQALNNLIDVEQEFEQHRKKSLEREQKLRRQLQDEINKQRNS
ncbi:hypothetical protein [Polaribacter sp. Hel1_85]|uniref:hypothetical protein n=1 Tax=Polaribacter sp. Hel1_85 TaxID=1250005 RepID=UPI00052D6FA2|nr:hypothetical protein [Polaribacter sp. Hel1_85]KGL61675.1 hypothetical protein PHEL85_1456 [Polaribacter sp. Hel1_85]